jgi:hypothetical protein
MTPEEKEKLESEYFRCYFDFRKYNRGDENDKDEISIALQHPGGGVTGEFQIEWINLGTHGFAPQIKIFNDGLHVFLCFQEVFEDLYDKYEDCDYTIDELIEHLESHGFINDDSFEGDYIPEEMFENYQKGRRRKKNLEDILD